MSVGEVKLGKKTRRGRRIKIPEEESKTETKDEIEMPIEIPGSFKVGEEAGVEGKIPSEIPREEFLGKPQGLAGRMKELVDRISRLESLVNELKNERTSIEKLNEEMIKLGARVSRIEKILSDLEQALA